MKTASCFVTLPVSRIERDLTNRSGNIPLKNVGEYKNSLVKSTVSAIERDLTNTGRSGNISLNTVRDYRDRLLPGHITILCNMEREIY